MRRWRLYAATIALAAIVGAAVALTLSGGPRVSREPDVTSAAIPSRSVATTGPAPSPSPSPSTQSREPTSSPGVTLRVAAPTRTILGTTLLVTSGADPTTLLAIPVSSSAPPNPSPSIPASAGPAGPYSLATFGRGAWQMRADGSALAVSTGTTTAARISVWNLRTGSIAALTPDESGVVHATPVWSADGSLLYYASSRGPTDLGIWRIRADGTANTLVRRPDGKYAGVELRGLTPDGAGLVFSYARAGGSANVFDLVTGADRAFDDSTAASITAWRATRPRALVLVGGGAAQPPATLTLWDDLSGTKRILLGPSVPGSPTGVYGADFEPTGTRIAVAVYNRIGENESSAIQLIDANGNGRTPVPGSEGAQSVLWFRAGIVFTRRSATGGTDVMLIQPTGGTPVTLYRDPEQLGKVTFVSP